MTKQLIKNGNGGEGKKETGPCFKEKSIYLYQILFYFFVVVFLKPFSGYVPELTKSIEDDFNLFCFVFFLFLLLLFAKVFFLSLKA